MDEEPEVAEYENFEPPAMSSKVDIPEPTTTNNNNTTLNNTYFDLSQSGEKQ